MSGGHRWQVVVHGETGVPADYAEHRHQEDREPGEEMIVMSPGSCDIIIINCQVTFLKSVPLLSTFPAEILAKISDVLELEVYKKGKTNRRDPAV